MKQIIKEQSRSDTSKDQFPSGNLLEYFKKNQERYSCSLEDFKRFVVEAQYKSIVFDKKITVDNEPDSWKIIREVMRDRNLELSIEEDLLFRPTSNELEEIYQLLRKQHESLRFEALGSNGANFERKLFLMIHPAVGQIRINSLNASLASRIVITGSNEDVVANIPLDALFLEIGTLPSNGVEGLTAELEKRLAWIRIFEERWQSQLKNR